MFPKIVSSFLALVFAVTFHQAPLYRINQHTYMLHGLAEAGLRNLNLDWQAQTTDPVPVFSALISITVQLISENAIYFLYIGILTVFCFSILGIVRNIFDFKINGWRHLIYFSLFTLWYSDLLVNKFFQIPEDSQLRSFLTLADILKEGVANQYVLGDYFQPSVFGVFFILSIYCFIMDKPYLAAIWLAVASTFHSTYLLNGAILTIIYMAIIFKNEKNFRKPILLGLFTLVLVTPILIYIISNFSPTSSAISEEAQRILVEYRIPHHTLVSNWFDFNTVIRLTAIGVGIVLVRGTRLFPVLVGSFVASLGLTVVQILTGSKFLALLFPWRSSVYLVPIASAIILAKIVSVRLKFFDSSSINKFPQFKAIIWVLILFLGYVGIGQINELRLAPRLEVDEAIRFVRNNYQPGDLYLIPLEMSHFRINAGVPVFVDVKSHPAKDTEILEWYERLKIVHEHHIARGQNACTILNNLAAENNITHRVYKHEDTIPDCPNLIQVFQGEDVLIFKIQQFSTPSITDPD
jgi:hypothetical protein